MGNQSRTIVTQQQIFTPRWNLFRHSFKYILHGLSTKQEVSHHFFFHIRDVNWVTEHVCTQSYGAPIVFPCQNRSQSTLQPFLTFWFDNFLVFCTRTHITLWMLQSTHGERASPLVTVEILTSVSLKLFLPRIHPDPWPFLTLPPHAQDLTTSFLRTPCALL